MPGPLEQLLGVLGRIRLPGTPPAAPAPDRAGREGDGRGPGAIMVREAPAPAPPASSPAAAAAPQQRQQAPSATPAGPASGPGGAGGPLPLSRPVDREELGRATWVLLHTLAAQFPERPSRQQRKDAAALVDLLTRIYPCSDCARHFQEVVRRSPVAAGSGRELQQWMCGAHNAVNRSLSKPEFNCRLVGARWRSLDCDEGDTVCSLAPPPGAQPRP